MQLAAGFTGSKHRDVNDLSYCLNGYIALLKNHLRDDCKSAEIRVYEGFST